MLDTIIVFENTFTGGVVMFLILLINMAIVGHIVPTKHKEP